MARTTKGESLMESRKYIIDGARLEAADSMQLMHFCKSFIKRIQPFGIVVIAIVDRPWEDREIGHLLGCWATLNKASLIENTPSRGAWRFTELDERALALLWMSRAFFWEIQIRVESINLVIDIDSNSTIRLSGATPADLEAWQRTLQQMERLSMGDFLNSTGPIADLA
jgi:hypothetical protein